MYFFLLCYIKIQCDFHVYCTVNVLGLSDTLTPEVRETQS